MRALVDWERFEPGSLGWFYRLLGLTLLARIATDLHVDLWAVHDGRLFPWRHLPGLPLYPPAGLAIEWAMMGLAALAITTGFRLRAGVYLALLVSAVSLTQRYANHRALLLLVLAFLALSPVEPRRPGLSGERHPNLALIRYQLVIVYLFSALNKVRAGFLEGTALQHLLDLDAEPARALAWLVVAAEFSLPLLLWRLPWLGLGGVACLHLGFALFMPAIWPFSLLMLAMAVLFVGDTRDPGALPLAGADAVGHNCS
ncbi:MAG: hypothetical protein OEZ06_10470 [Myxococcales bacterium]|nr:hypothetical protein [Myxococcales bacterium]